MMSFLNISQLMIKRTQLDNGITVNSENNKKLNYEYDQASQRIRKTRPLSSYFSYTRTLQNIKFTNEMLLRSQCCL